MSNLEVWLIIILVVGVIGSNLAVLKHSAKFKMTQFGKPVSKPNKSDQNKSELDKSVETEQDTSQTRSDKDSK